MPEVVRTEGVLGGEPRIEGRRVSVLQVADVVLDGGDDPEYVADQLGVSLAGVHAALSYYDEHPDEVEAVRERHSELETKLAERATALGDVTP